MTVQAQNPAFGSRGRTGSRGVRGLKAWIVGIVALAAAGTGIGIAVSSSSNEAPATRIAPVNESNAEQPEVVWYLPGKPGIK